MKKKSKISRFERLEIGLLLKKGYGIRAIARVLDRSPGSISEEVKKNSVKGEYQPIKAHQKAHVRARFRRYQWRKIDACIELREYILAGLRRHWNPDEISGRIKRDHLPFYASKTAIYEWLRTSVGDRYIQYLYSRRHYPKRRRCKVDRILIPNRVGIEKRPRGAKNRTRYGHWEGDTLVSGKKTGSKAALSVFYERKARYLVASKLSNLKPSSHLAAVRAMTHRLLVRSSTWDNGIENREHQSFGHATFFCDPYSSWQKGGVEHANRMLRRYLPKRTDLAQVSEFELAWIVATINAKPRRSLGYATAAEIAAEHGILKGGKTSIKSKAGVRIQG